MTMKDDLIHKLESQIEAWDKEIDAAKAEADKKEAEAETEKAAARLKEEAMNPVHMFQEKVDSAKKMIRDMQEAGEDRMDAFREKMNGLLS